MSKLNKSISRTSASFYGDKPYLRGYYSEDIIQESFENDDIKNDEKCSALDENTKQSLVKDAPILRQINITQYSGHLGAAHKWIQIKGRRVTISFPIETFQPKVQLMYETRPNILPKKVAIERKRRHFASINWNDIFSRANLDVSTLIPVHTLKRRSKSHCKDRMPELPLEWFDDFEYDTLLPQGWLNMGLLEDGVRHPLPANAFLPQYWDDSTMSIESQEKNTTSYAWSIVAVRDYEPTKRRWLVTDLNNNRTYQIPRIYLMFWAEDPTVFLKRIRAACTLRENAEKHLYLNIILDCMILTGVPVPGIKLMDKISLLTSNENATNLSIHKHKQEAILDYQRTLGKLELLFNISTQSKEYAFITVPKFDDTECRKKPKIMQIDIAPTNFEYLKQLLRFSILYCLPEVIRAMDNAVIECAKVSQMLLFSSNLSKTVTLQEFIEIQKQTSSNSLLYLKGIWTDTVSGLICMSLRSVAKGWFDIKVGNWEIYAVSKMLRFMNLIKFHMENAIRNLMENSIKLYKNHLCKSCECLIHVTETFQWDINLLVSPFNETEPHVFYLILNMDKDRAFYSTDPDEFVPNLIQIFDDTMRQTHFIHVIDPIALKNLVFADNLYLSSIGMVDMIITSARSLVMLSYEKAMIPLRSYANKYESHLELFNLDNKKYIRNFKELNKNAQEIQDEINYHLRMKEYLETTIPDNIIIGPFLINVFPLKSFLVKKRADLATLVIEFLMEKLKTETLVLVEAYAEIFKRLNEKPISIEYIFATRKWMETVPQEVQEYENEMKLKLFEYDILDNFFQPLPNENFNIKWQGLAGPLKCLRQIKLTTEMFEEESERFLKQQVSDLGGYDEKVEVLNMTVSNFTTQFDVTKATETAIEIKKTWKNIIETEDLGKLLNKRQLLFELPEIDLTPIRQLLHSFMPYKTLWSTAAEFLKWEEGWFGNPLSTVATDKIRETIAGYKSDLMECIETFNELPKNQEVTKYFVDRILEFEPKLSCLEWLLNPAWVSYHWQKLNKMTELNIKFSLTMNFTYLLQKNIMDYAELVKEISESATANKDELEAKLRAEEERKLAEERELLERKNRRRGRKLE